MGNTNKLLKNISIDSKSFDNTATADDMLLINALAKDELKPEDVYTFKVRLCDSQVDRVFDKMTHGFLEEFAAKAKTLVGLKDHIWSVDKQWARVYDTSVVTDEDGIEYVEGKAYTLVSNASTVEAIKAGIIKEVSVSFNDVSYCSICGKPMHKDWDGIGVCENEHHAGKEYDGKQCLSLLTECTDVFEWSIVSVPCQRDAGIKNKSLNQGGNGIMKKGMLALKKLMALNKSAENPDEQIAELLDIVAGNDAETELTPEDIERLVEENEELKARCKELEEQLKTCKEEADAQTAQAEQAAIETVVENEVEKLCPLTATVKENILRDIDRKDFKLVDGKVEGLDAQIEVISKKYEGLFGKKSAPEVPNSKDVPENSETPKAVTKKSVRNGLTIR